MAAALQRSITFPPIRIQKLDSYVIHVAKNAVSLKELREAGLEFGRGRGDITRFLERLGVVEVADGVVRLTGLGMRLVSLRELIGVSVYYALFYQRVPQFKLLMEVLRERSAVEREELYKLVNGKLSELSPTAWLNKVAFRTLLQLAEELGAVDRDGGSYRYLGDPVERAVATYYGRHGVKIGQSLYVPPDKVLTRECGREKPPQGLYEVDLRCTVWSLYSIFATT
ncbi:conserved hypothetical protein [Pyrobaculum neutrophilum V24Sta]|uniref:Uncharacterized protein n=1 Tax=Pyrobaculum neutrophilum (strain DSM 2338 / JCM 9278 / NBRC 100436 / V24Sta) TaxID=444157 RepID=B1YCU8_PYRNV|nr:conserved hypothetical protein [Pyrobaculum neutrophilum V24Sta]